MDSKTDGKVTPSDSNSGLGQSLPDEPPTPENQWHEHNRKQKHCHPKEEVHSFLPPFSNKLKFDNKLILSHADFEQAICDWSSSAKPVYEVQHPTPHLLAKFSKLVYEDQQLNETEKTKLPDSWKLLTTAANGSLTNGYFGAAYWQPQQQLVIVAHRGTCLTKFGAVFTDIAGIVLNNYVSQMNSACTFAHKVKEALQKANDNGSAHFQLFFTGHSLGGWLAQITAFCTEYLDRKDKYFLLEKDTVEDCAEKGFHAHTVVFDSPGCMAMLKSLRKSLDVQYFGKSVNLETLDITSYLSAPNIVNTCNSHVGTLFRLFVDLSGMNLWQKNIELFYTKATHSMDGILDALDPNSGKIRTNDDAKFKIHIVIDWPVSNWLSEEYRTFFRWALHLNEYHPDEKLEEFQAEIRKSEGYYPIRYQTSKFNDNTCKINVFKQSEQDFLIRYMWLRKSPDFFETHALFSQATDSKILVELLASLDNYEIRDQWLYCTSAAVLRRLISLVKSFLKFHPGIVLATINALSSFPKRRKLYQSATSDYLTKIPKLSFSFEENSNELTDFLANDSLQAWNVKTKHSTLSSVAKLYKKFETRSSDANYNVNSCTVLDIKTISELSSRLFSLSDYLCSDEITNHLLIVEGIPESDSEKFETAQKFINAVFTILERKTTLKIILVTNESDKLTEMFQEHKETKDNNTFLITEDTNDLWLDLAVDSQKTLLLKENINFQNRDNKTSLGKLIGVNSFDKQDLDSLNTILDTETVLKLQSDEEFFIGSESQQLCDLKAAYAKIYEEISDANLASEILKSGQEPSIFLISYGDATETDLRGKLMKRLPQDVDIVEIECKMDNRKCASRSKVVCLVNDVEANEKPFKNLCRSNQHKTIYWLKVTPVNFVWLQVYNRKFYCPRQFKCYDKIILKKEIREQLVANEISDRFIFSEVAAIETLENVLGITETRIKEQLSTILNKSTAFASSEENAKELFENWSKQEKPVHWLKIEKVDNVSNLVWNSSHGPLNTLRKYVDSSKSLTTTVNETDFCQRENKVVIFADVPGMGKSASLISLSDQLASDWVIHLNLKDCKTAIKSIPPNNLTISHVVEFLVMTGSMGLDSCLSRALLTYALQGHKGKDTIKIYILFDGFDEIREDPIVKNSGHDHGIERNCTLGENVSRLFQFIKKKTSAKIWITTRDYRKQHLENNLSVFSTTFVEIDQDTQIEFLKTFWKVCLSLKHPKFGEIEEKLTEYAKQIVYAEKKILRGKFSVMGHPLVMRMLAESVQPKPELLDKNEFKVKLRTIVQLYQCFIEMKYDIYLKEKVGLGSNLESLHKACLTDFLTKRHRHLAFQLLFPNEADDFLGKKHVPEANDDRTVSDDLAEFNHAGLIRSTQGDSKFEFIHDSCAEYFTADLLFSWLVKPQGRHHQYPAVEEFLLTQVLTQPEHEIVRLFLNGQINKKSTEFYRAEIVKHCSNKNYSYQSEQKTALHVVAEEKHEKIAEFLLCSFRKMPEVLIELLCIRDEHGDSMLYVAVKAGSTKIVNQVMKCVRKCSSSLKHKLLLATIFRRADDVNNAIIKKCIESFLSANSEMNDICNTIKENWKLITPFLEAAKEGRLDEVEKCFNDGQSDFEKYYFASTTDRNRKTALHFAAERGHIEVARFLLKQNASVHARDTNLKEGKANLTALHYAAKSGKRDMLSILMDSGALVDCLDRSGMTSLHHAINSCKYDCVVHLMNSGADVTIKGKNGMTTLCWAAKCGTPETIELVIDKTNAMMDEQQRIKYLNESDKHGMTSFYHALKVNNWNNAEKLAAIGADIDIADLNGRRPIERVVGAGKWNVVEKMMARNAKIDFITPEVIERIGRTDVTKIVGWNDDVVSLTVEGKVELLKLYCEKCLRRPRT